MFQPLLIRLNPSFIFCIAGLGSGKSDENVVTELNSENQNTSLSLVDPKLCTSSGQLAKTPIVDCTQTPQKSSGKTKVVKYLRVSLVSVKFK